MTSLSKADIKDKDGTLQNISVIELSDQLKELYSAQSYIPALIEDMEGMKEHSMKDYYVKLKMVIQEEDVEEKMDVGFDKIGGQKININIEDLFDKIKGLGSASKILIVGGAGVGKSTLMQYMAYKWSQDQLWEKKFDLVYRITLKTLLSNSWKQQYYSNKIYSSEIDKKPLRYIIHHNIQRVADPDQIKQIRPEDIQLTQNNLLLLDGYDEITHLQDDLTYQALQGEIFEQNYVILTSRPNAVDQQFKAKFNRIIENVGLDNEGMDQFINLWFQEEGKEEVKGQKQVAQNLLSNSQIRSICYIPVNLAMLCYLCSQKNGSQKEVKVFNSCQLYQQVVLKLGERYISKDFRGALQEGQSLQEKIQIKLANLPEIKVLQHIAYMGLTGGGVENQNQKNKQLLIIKTYSGSKDNWGISIQNSIKALNAEVNVDRLVKFGLLKQEGNNHKNKEYCFIHLSFQEYLAAEYLIEKITLGTEAEYRNVIKYISMHRNEPKLLLTLKFMCGILTQQYHLEALQDFWNSMSCNVEGLLEFAIEGKIRLLANMLGQAYRQDEQNKLILDERIPNLKEIVDIVNMVIITDIKQFKELLKDSHYVSESIQKVIEGFLKGEDRRLEVVQQIYESYFPTNKNQDLLQIIKENKDSCIKQVIGHIFKSFSKEQQNSSNQEQLESGTAATSQSSQSINKTSLMQTGLDLALYIPQKIQTKYLEDSIVQLLETKGDWQVQRFALFSYGQICQAIKLDNSLLHERILNFILQLNLANENVISKDQQDQSTDQNLLDTVFGIINHSIVELDAPRVYIQIAKIFNYCFYNQQDTLLVLMESIKQNIQNSKALKKKDTDKLITLSAEFAVQAMNQIIGSGDFINEKQKFISVFNIIPLLLQLLQDEKQKEIYLDKAIDLFYKLLNEQTTNSQLIQIVNSLILLQKNIEAKKKTNQNALSLLCNILQSGQCSMSQDLFNLSIFLLKQEIDDFLKQQAAEEIVHQLAKTLENITEQYSRNGNLYEAWTNFLSLKLKNQVKIITDLLYHFILEQQKKENKQLTYFLADIIYDTMESLQDNDIVDIIKNILEKIFENQVLFSIDWVSRQNLQVLDEIVPRIRNQKLQNNISILIFDRIIASMNDLEDQPFHINFHILYSIFELILSRDLQQKYLKQIARFQLVKYKSQREYVHFYEIESFLKFITDEEESLNILINVFEHDITCYKQNMLNDQSERISQQIIVKVDKSEMDKSISRIAKILLQIIYSNDIRLQEMFEQDIESLLKSHDKFNTLGHKMNQFIIWVNRSLQQQPNSQNLQNEIQIGLFELLISQSKDESAILNNIFKNLISYIQNDILDVGIQKQSNNNRISLIYTMIRTLLKLGKSIQIDEGIATQYFNLSFQILESQEIEVSKLIYECIPLIQVVVDDSQTIQLYIQNFFEFASNQIYRELKDDNVKNFFISILDELVKLMDKKMQKEYFEKSIKIQLEQFQILNTDSEIRLVEPYNLVRDATLIYNSHYEDSNFLKQILLEKWFPLIENDDVLTTKKGLYMIRILLIYLDKELLEQQNLLSRLKVFLQTDKQYLKNDLSFIIFLDRILNAFDQIGLNLQSNFVFLHLQNILETLSQDYVEDYYIKEFKYFIQTHLNEHELYKSIQLGLKSMISQLSSSNLKENKQLQRINDILIILTLKLIKSGQKIQIGAVIIESDVNYILQTNSKSIYHLKEIQPILFMLVLLQGQDHYSSIVKQLTDNCLNTDQNLLLDSDLHDYFESFSLIFQHLIYSEQKSFLIEWMIKLLLKAMKQGQIYERTFILKKMSILFNLEKNSSQWFKISKQTIDYIKDNLQESDTLIKAIHMILISQKNTHPETQQQIMNLAFKSLQKSSIQKIEQLYLERISQIKQNYIKIQNLLKIQEMSSYKQVTQEINVILHNQFQVEEIANEFCLGNKEKIFEELVLQQQVMIHEQPVKRDKNQLLKQQQQDQIPGDGLKLLKVFNHLNQICQLLQKQMDCVYQQHFNLSSYEFILVILNIVSFENEETSDRKDLIKECKSLLITNLKYMNQEGISWILSNISQISVLSHLSKMVVLKVCDTIFEDGIISDNSDKTDGINEFRVLIEIIRSKANVILNDKNQLTVEGKTYNLNLSQNDWIIMDKEISLMIQDSDNPFILQYAKYNPLFQNNSLDFQSSLDQKICSIIDMNCINSKIKDVKIDSQWRLVELKAHNGNKLIFFEKRNVFGRRIVSLIDFEKQSVKQILDSNRVHIFGQYKGPMMFYSKITKKKYPKQSTDEKQLENLSNTINNYNDWRYISKECDFIQCYNYFCQNKELTVSSPTFVIYHDALLRLEVTSDRMQDIVFFEFMKTIKDQKESLKHELNALSIPPEEQQALLEYFDGFVKTFNLTYTEASIIVSGKFEYNQGSTGVTILSKIASCLPFIGDVASSTIESVGEFINNIEIKRNANTILNFAFDHCDLSQQACLISKQIIITNHKKLRENDFQVGYMDIFNTQQDNQQKKQAFLKKFAEKILGKIEDLNKYIESNLYGNLYEGKYSQLGNSDASQFIEIYCGKNSTEKIDKIYKEIQYSRKQINSQKNQKQLNEKQINKSSCSCSIF